MKFIEVGYMPYQFVIIPAIGIIKRRSGCYRYTYRIGFIWGFWGISFGLGKPLYSRKED